MMEGSNTTLEANLAHWMLQHLSGATDLSLVDFRAPEAGASNETLLFTARWREHDALREQLYVVRMQPKGTPVFPQYDLAAQYRAMHLLQGTEVKVPRLIGFEADESLLNPPFYVMQGIAGKVVAEQPPYYMDGWFTGIEPEARAQMWRSGIAAIASVNRQDWKALGFECLLPSQKTPLRAEIDKYADFLRWTEKKGQPYPALWALHAWLIDQQPKDEPIALCWGDAKVSNLLFENGSVSAVLDWEMVHLGNPVDDLAWWVTLDNSMSEGLERLVGMDIPRLPGVLSKVEVIALWEAESGYSAEHFDYYEVLGAFRFGIIMASVSVNLMNAGVMPKEMEMDINNTCTPLIDRLIKTHGIR